MACLRVLYNRHVHTPTHLVCAAPPELVMHSEQHAGSAVSGIGTAHPSTSPTVSLFPHSYTLTVAYFCAGTVLGRERPGWGCCAEVRECGGGPAVS